MAYQGPLKTCVVGDGAEAVQYASDRILPIINNVMADLCLEKHPAPLRVIQKALRTQSELRSARVAEVKIQMPPRQPAASGDGLIGLVQSSRRASLDAPSKPSTARALGNSSSLSLRFVSRPCLLTKPKDHPAVSKDSDDDSTDAAAPPTPQHLGRPTAVLPRSFAQCGEYPVFVSEAPTKAMMPVIAKAVRDTAACEHLTFLLVSTDATVMTYMGEQPYKARVPESVWAQLKKEATNAGFSAKINHQTFADSLGASGTTPRVTAGSGGSVTPRGSGKRSTPTAPSHSSQANGTKRGAPLTPTARTEQHVAVDDATLEQLINAEVVAAAGRKGNAAGISDVLHNLASAAAASSSLGAETTPSSPPTPQHAVFRLFHPANVAVSKPFVDVLWNIVHHTVTATPKTTFVVLSVDQAALAQHVAVLVCLYYRTNADVHSWKHILNATERLRDRSYVYDFEKIEAELAQGRSKRDNMRSMLKGAQVAQLKETGLMHTANEFCEKWESVSAWHHERREKEDARRNALNIMQGSDAAVRVQSIMRGAITRRRTNGVLKKMKLSAADYEGPYRRGRYPMVDATMEYLQYVFGAQFITSETMRKGSTKMATRWKRGKIRVAPQADYDVSSEEETWEEEQFEKLSSEGTGAINPLHMVDLCMSAAMSLDKDILFDAFVNYPGVSPVQEKAMRSLERLIHYIMVCVFWTSKHRVREGNHPEAGPYASTNLLNLPTKLKSCDTYQQFCAIYRRPQEWLNQPQFSLLLLSNMPTPLHESRLMMASPQAPNGSTVEGVGRVDVLMPNSPIFLVPEGSSVDQWAESVNTIQKATARCRKVLWLSTCPNFVIYVNGVPFHFVERQKGSVFTPSAALAARVRAPLESTVVKPARTSANPLETTTPTKSATLTNSDEVLVETSEALASPQFSDKRKTGGRTNTNPFSPFAAKMSPSTSQLALPGGGSPQFVALDGSTAVAGSPSALSGSLHASRRRQSSIVTEGAAPLKRYEAGWYGISWENIENALIAELTEVIDDPRHDGFVACFSLSTTNMRLASNSLVALWEQHRLQIARFSPPQVDFFRVRATMTAPHQHGGSRGSRQSSLHVTPRGSVQHQSIALNATSAARLAALTPHYSAGDENTSPQRSSAGSHATSPNLETSGRRAARRVGGRRASMSSRRSSDVGGNNSSKSSHANDVEESAQLPLAYPFHARDALRTPAQAADEVREKLRGTNGDVSLVFRRLPMLPSFGDEWLRNLDAVLRSLREHLVDPFASVAVCVSSPDSVWFALFGAVLWEVEAKGVAPRKTAPTTAANLNTSNANLTTPQAVSGMPTPLDAALLQLAPEFVASYEDIGHTADSATNYATPRPADVTSPNMLTFTSLNFGSTMLRGVPPSNAELLVPLSVFPVLKVLGEEIPQLRMEASVMGVMNVLYQSQTKALMYDRVMQLMDDADASTGSGSPTALTKQLCLQAVEAFEKFVLLIVFHSFLLYHTQDTSSAAQAQLTLAQRLQLQKQQQQQQQVDTYFKDFVLNTPNLYLRIHNVSPWESSTRRCPLGEQATYAFLTQAGCSASVGATAEHIVSCLDGDHRWRSDVLMPNFS